MKEWKEYIFYVTSSILYLGMSTLIMIVQSNITLKTLLAFGLIINHLLLAVLIFKFDIDDGDGKDINGSNKNKR